MDTRRQSRFIEIQPRPSVPSTRLRRVRSGDYLPEIPCTEPLAVMLLSIPLLGSVAPIQHAEAEIRAINSRTPHPRLGEARVREKRATATDAATHSFSWMVTWVYRRTRGPARAPGRQTANWPTAMSEHPHPRGLGGNIGVSLASEARDHVLSLALTPQSLARFPALPQAPPKGVP